MLTSDLRSNSIFTEFLFSLMRGERRVPPPVKFSTKKIPLTGTDSSSASCNTPATFVHSKDVSGEQQCQDLPSSGQITDIIAVVSVPWLGKAINTVLTVPTSQIF